MRKPGRREEFEEIPDPMRIRWGLSWEERNGTSWAWRNPYSGPLPEVEGQPRIEPESPVDVEQWVQSETYQELELKPSNDSAGLVVPADGVS